MGSPQIMAFRAIPARATLGRDDKLRLSLHPKPRIPAACRPLDFLMRVDLPRLRNPRARRLRLFLGGRHGRESGPLTLWRRKRLPPPRQHAKQWNLLRPFVFDRAEHRLLAPLALR